MTLQPFLGVMQKPKKKLYKICRKSYQKPGVDSSLKLVSKLFENRALNSTEKSKLPLNF